MGLEDNRFFLPLWVWLFGCLFGHSFCLCLNEDSVTLCGRELGWWGETVAQWCRVRLVWAALGSIPRTTLLQKKQTSTFFVCLFCFCFVFFKSKKQRTKKEEIGINAPKKGKEKMVEKCKGDESQMDRTESLQEES